MEKRYYIAYGSNLNIRQMRMRCSNARIIGTSELEGYKLFFEGSKTGAYLTIKPHESCSVPVAVWEITPEDEAALDRYEGYPLFYHKQEMTIPVKGICSGKVREKKAFAYIMREDCEPDAPSIKYFITCLRGYEDFDFDPTFLMMAYLRSVGELCED